MIQDTSLQNEMYLAGLSNDRCGGWGIQPTHNDHDSNSFDPDRLGTASIFWAISQVSLYINPLSPISSPFQEHLTSVFVSRYFIPFCVACSTDAYKVYDNAEVESLHSTDVVTFVGITSSESLSIEDDSSPEVPVLHVLCYQVASANPILTNIDVSVRTDLIDWISGEALGGDNDAAEWLLQLASKIHTRAIPLLPPSLTISRFPQPSSAEFPPTLSHVLEELLPQYLLIPLSLDLLNKIPFLPESKDEDLHSGYLQLPTGTAILLTETAIQEGKLLERGITNVQAIQDVMNSQTVEYIFPFSSKFTFHTDISMVVVSEGRKSAFFQTSINFPLRCSDTTPHLYKPKDDIFLPPAGKMAVYRSYIAACKAVSEKVQVTEETSKHIQDDFVRRRQQDKSVTPDELIHLMKVARLLAASWLQNEVTIDVWEKAKELDRRRQALIDALPCSAYLVNVDIGGQDFWVTFDTGSSDLVGLFPVMRGDIHLLRHALVKWVVSSGCTDADCQGVSTYSPSASSTLHLSDTAFKLLYLLGSVQGSVATEIVTLGAIQIVSQTFGTIAVQFNLLPIDAHAVFPALADETNQLYLATTGNSGILGLSFPPAAAIRSTVGTTLLGNIFSHLDEPDRFFAFKLGRNSSDPSAINSSFTIGTLDPSVVDTPNGTAQLTYFPVFKTESSPYDYWKLPILNLTINGLLLPLSPSLVPGAPSPIGILDTGTTLILGPTVDVTAFWDSIGTGGSTRYNAQSNLWEVRCDRAVDVRFALGQGDGGREYAVHPEDITWAEGKQKDGWCMGGVQINDGVRE
ncbi:aspartic peptidase domain-containing protein [Butyriboletus roseoflavus]|nr:aspartic peptidase domain-containing protein [Butyriboletus roseoflavus]